MSTRPQVVAVDLDGTVLNDEYPNIGKPIDGMREELEALRQCGWKIVIWTVRDNDAEVSSKLKEYGIPFDHINENPWGPPKQSRKIYADVYLDDRALTFEGTARGIAKKVLEFKPWHRR
jgi:hypothetical protein